RIPVERGEKRLADRVERRLRALRGRGRDGAEPVQSLGHPLEEIAHAAALSRAPIGLPALRRVGEQELVARLYRLYPARELRPRLRLLAHRSTCQRRVSCSRKYSSRVIQPRSIARVNKSFSGRSAKYTCAITSVINASAAK